MTALRMGRQYCIQILFEVSQRAHLLDTFTDPFECPWEFQEQSHTVDGHVSAIVDSTHVAIKSSLHPVDRELSRFDKRTYRGRALVFNAMINCGREIIACLLWYTPTTTGQYLHQHLRRLQADLRRESFKIINL